MLEYELVIITNRSEKNYGYSIRTVYRGSKDTRRVLEVITNEAPFGTKLAAFDAGSVAMVAFIRELPD